MTNDSFVEEHQKDHPTVPKESRHADCLSDLEEERARIGADLHDGLGQELTGLALMLQALEQRAQRDSPTLASEIGRLSHMANASITSIRDIARGLLPVGLQRGDFRNALHALARSTRRIFGVGVTARFRGDPTDYLTGHVAQHLYRIIQEAIGNAVKHGRAQQVSVTVHRRESNITVTVLDDGLGFDTVRPSRGIGLWTMHHRAHVIGGLLQAQHARGRVRGSVASCRAATGSDRRHFDRGREEPSTTCSAIVEAVAHIAPTIGTIPFPTAPYRSPAAIA